MAESSLVARARQALGGSGADLALAVVLAVFAELDVLLSKDWRGLVFVNAVVVPAMALSLAFRRRRPLTTLAVVIGGFVGLSLAFGASQTWSNVFIIVIAVYSAVMYGSAPLLAAALATVGLVVGTLTDPLVHGFGDAVWGPSLIVLTVGAALTGRGLRARTSTLDHRAEALDRVEQMLMSFSPEDIEDMAENGRVHVTCEFCKSEYGFDAAELGAKASPVQ